MSVLKLRLLTSRGQEVELTSLTVVKQQMLLVQGAS